MRARWVVRVSLVTSAALTLLLTQSGAASASPSGRRMAASEARTLTNVPFSITTSPGLNPSFNPNIHYYVLRCSDAPSTTIAASGSGKVSIGGQRVPEPASISVPLAANQAITVSHGTQKYAIRCLPADFPNYAATQSGISQGSGFLVAPNVLGSTSQYVIAFDSNDVPVWWERQGYAQNPMFFGQSQIGWWTGAVACGGGCGAGQYTIRTLDGAPALTLGGSVNPSAPIDFHDFQKVSGNRYLATMYVPGQTADLTSWGLSSNQTVTDSQIVELNKQSQIVWRWSALAHIDPATSNINWRTAVPDVFHINSVQMVGNQIIVSFRHLDAVYDIDATTGNVIWKLGGTPTLQGLTVTGNSTFNTQAYPQLFSGQHDAKLQADGTLTVHDNAASENRPSRALRFQINPTAMSATVIEDVTDANHPIPSFCCGSVQKLSTGNWLVDWGAGNYVAELDPLGTTVNQISYGPATSYRVSPVTATDAALSRGMDAMFPPFTS
jgi:hypothetical protein